MLTATLGILGFSVLVLDWLLPLETVAASSRRSIGRAESQAVQNSIDARDALNQSVNVGQVVVRFENALEADAALDLPDNQRQNIDVRV
jgi:hypothetical protein